LASRTVAATEGVSDLSLMLTRMRSRRSRPFVMG
jgi:hypothetical protein